jgi:hypothetical protein
MGQVSQNEDIEEGRIEAVLHQQFAEYEAQLIDRFRKGSLSEEALQRELKSLRLSIVTPLEAIINKFGRSGPDLGNQLLRLRAEINDASSAMAGVLTKLASHGSASAASAKSLPDFLETFLENYRLLLRVIHLIAQPLNVQDRQTLNQIRVSCEDEIKKIKTLPAALRAREEAIARLYVENETLRDERDLLMDPKRTTIAAAGDKSWNDVTDDPGVNRLHR